MQCADCTHHKCYLEGRNCTRKTLEDVKALYDEKRTAIMRAAAATEGRHYCQMTRLEESAEFARLMGAQKIGVAFCIGLSQEAHSIAAYFKKFFTVHSVCCKVCAVDKKELGLEQIKPDACERMCNPLMQAQILMDQGVEMCFTVGLCVGHDMLFNQGCTVPVSCLAVKDRVLAHNPLGAVYSRYWRRRLGVQEEGEH